MWVWKLLKATLASLILAFFEVSGAPKFFQNLSVSSAAADTTVYPSGLWRGKKIGKGYQDKSIHKGKTWMHKKITFHTCAIWRTREVCPVSSVIFTMDGYFHKVNWFLSNPCELNNSRSCLFHSKEQTWEWVSIVFKHAPVWVCQNFIDLSKPPPPDAKRLFWKGHHAKAFTAAQCSSNLCRYWEEELWDAMLLSQMYSRLSLPPLASCLPEEDHFNPQTSWVCPLYVWTMCSGMRTSWLITIPSSPPVVRIGPFQARAPMPSWWPSKALNCNFIHVEFRDCHNYLRMRKPWKR